MKNAHEYKGLYDGLDIDLRELGCLMLDVGSPWSVLPEEVKSLQYISPDPKKFWIKGLLNDWHVTARYGFLSNVRRSHVDKVLADIEIPEQLYTGQVEIFPSPYEDEKYDCYVLRIEDDLLHDINQQLSVLPNLNTFPEYKPHITLGYFQSGHEELKEEFFDCTFEAVATIGWNYGHILSKED